MKLFENYKCNKCNRSFINEKGLKTHERTHNKENNEILKDEKYIRKRIANTRSVQMHRQLYPKLKLEVLEANIKEAIEEAKLFESFIKNKLNLTFNSYKKKLENTDESCMINFF